MKLCKHAHHINLKHGNVSPKYWVLQCCWEEYKFENYYCEYLQFCHCELHQALMCKRILCVKPGFFIAISVILFHFIWLFLFYYPPANAELKLFGAFKSPHSQFICCLYSQFSYLAQLQRLSYRCMIAVLKQIWSCRLLALWCYVFANPVICSSTEFSVCFLLNLIV